MFGTVSQRIVFRVARTYVPMQQVVEPVSIGSGLISLHGNDESHIWFHNFSPLVTINLGIDVPSVMFDGAAAACCWRFWRLGTIRVNTGEQASRCMGYERTICDGMPEVPCGSNTTDAFSARVLVDMAAIVVIVVKQVNDAKSVHGRAFTLPLHSLFHSSSPATSSLAFTQNKIAGLALAQRQ